MLTRKAKILSLIFYPLLTLCVLFIIYWIVDKPMDLLSTLVVLTGVTLIDLFVIRSRHNLYKLIVPTDSKDQIISVLKGMGYTNVIKTKNLVRLINPSSNPMKEKEIIIKDTGTAVEFFIPEDKVSAFEGMKGVQFIGN